MTMYPHHRDCACPDCNPPRDEQITPRRSAHDAQKYWTQLYAETQALR